MVDLWPRDITVIKTIKSPVTILREQASLLGEKTKNLVQAEVVKTPILADEKLFCYIFNIVALALGHYRYQLFIVTHDIALYPLNIDAEDEILESIDFDQVKDFGSIRKTSIGRNKFTVESEEQFLQALKAIFNSGKAKRVITALLSQIEPSWEQPEDDF